MLVFQLLIVLLTLIAHASAERLLSGEEVGSFVSRMIDENEVMVFAKSTCPSCKSAKSILKTIKATFDLEVSVLDLDLMAEDDGPLVQMELLQRTFRSEVPYIFINSKSIGGNSELQTLVSSGKLQKLLAEVVASRQVVVRANYIRGTVSGNKSSTIL